MKIYKLVLLFIILIVSWSCRNQDVDKVDDIDNIEVVDENQVVGESGNVDENQVVGEGGNVDESEDEDQTATFDSIAANLSKKGSNDPELLVGEWICIKFAYTDDGNTISDVDVIPAGVRFVISDLSHWVFTYFHSWRVVPSISGNLMGLRIAENPVATPLPDETNMFTRIENAYSFVIQGDELIVFFTGNESMNLIIMKQKSPDDEDEESEIEIPDCETCEDDTGEDVPYKPCSFCEEGVTFPQILLGAQILNGIEVYLFKDSIPLKMEYEFRQLVSHFVCWIIVGSEMDNVWIHFNKRYHEGNGFGIAGDGRICNFPDFAKESSIPENGCKIYIEGLMYHPSCWGGTAQNVLFDYVLTKFKKIDYEKSDD